MKVFQMNRTLENDRIYCYNNELNEFKDDASYRRYGNPLKRKYNC